MYVTAIIYILLSGIAIQAGMCDSNNFKISDSCSFRNYLMTSYFEKYDCLVDSGFRDFITSYLHSQLCHKQPDGESISIRQSVLKRHLIGDGSHRHLSSSIKLDIDPKLASQLKDKYCEAIFIERLPIGVFADPFELQNLHQRGVFTDVAVFGDTNLELPSFLSNRSVVEVHMKVDIDNLLISKSGLEILLEVPLHARYPPLDESGYSVTEFGDLDLFVHCRMEENLCDQSCLYIPETDSSKSRLGAVDWRIPSGKISHAGFVSIVTFISACLSTLLIVFMSVSRTWDRTKVLKRHR